MAIYVRDHEGLVYSLEFLPQNTREKAIQSVIEHELLMAKQKKDEAFKEAKINLNNTINKNPIKSINSRYKLIKKLKQDRAYAIKFITENLMLFSEEGTYLYFMK